MKKSSIYTLILILSVCVAGCEYSLPETGPDVYEVGTANPLGEMQTPETKTEQTADVSPDVETQPPLAEETQPPQTNMPESTMPPENNTAQSEATEIGYSATRLDDKGKNRIHNLKMACDAINGYIVEPGEEFSFNGVVGSRSQRTGYRKAIIFKNYKKIYEYGGGICQISTTIYLAAKDAGLEITERHDHQMDVTYAEKGNDATVMYSKLDFKFKNTKAFPVRIEVFLSQNEVIAVIHKA